MITFGLFFGFVVMVGGASRVIVSTPDSHLSVAKSDTVVLYY